MCTYAQMHTHLYVTPPPKVDLNFLTHFTGKGGPSIFKWSALSKRSADWNVWPFWPRADFHSWLKWFEKSFQCQGWTQATPIVLWSIPEFSRTTRPKLIAGLRCVRSSHAKHTHTHIHTHTHTHPYVYLLHQERIWIFLHTLLEKVDHQYLNGQHLAYEVRTGICEVLTKSGLSCIIWFEK